MYHSPFHCRKTFLQICCSWHQKTLSISTLCNVFIQLIYLAMDANQLWSIVKVIIIMISERIVCNGIFHLWIHQVQPVQWNSVVHHRFQEISSPLRWHLYRKCPMLNWKSKRSLRSKMNPMFRFPWRQFSIQKSMKSLDRIFYKNI